MLVFFISFFQHEFHLILFFAYIQGETEGPRQPWHDLHCKIEGPAAYDILTNFEQRWRKATKFWVPNRLKRASHWRDDALLKLDRISWILNPSTIVDDPSLPGEDDYENWHVQVGLHLSLITSNFILLYLVIEYLSFLDF